MDEDAGATARLAVARIVHDQAKFVARHHAHVFAMHFLAHDLARSDGVIGRRRRIIDTDGVLRDLPVAWTRRSRKTETVADTIGAGGRAAVAFGLVRLAA